VKPRISCLDARFKYRSSANTDVAETFRQARRRDALVKRLDEKRSTRNVVPLKKTAEGGA
jgi:hypothetical protein